jgi:serine/threonine protein kinase/WD40 repeat protein
MHADQGKAKTIFLRAVEITAVEERRAYLTAACGGDLALFGEVQDLLRHQEQLGSFLESGLGKQDAGTEPSGAAPGMVIGAYKLLEQIGEGGFGIVFMGEQTEPVRRKVALKILKAGMDSNQVVARFEAERQALAIMDHPSIAKVFDGGATPLGRPYFVMELVKGVTITEYCDANHLSPRQRLELFVPLCQAVQHAHQKGIIHRDLKPSNVLVTVHDTTPVVKIIDFGVAKALGQELTDKTLCTGFAQMIGTPHYMSPEQAGQSGLDVDTRSDIYSLGVLLYELLTGSTPFTKDRFQKAAYDEIRRIICEEEPPRPSTRLSDLGRIRLTPDATAAGPAQRTTSLELVSGLRQTEPANLTKLVRGELDWIVMKCLEKDRGRRYASASGLAVDVQRYLSDEPVQAFPPSMGYRFRKFARRNRWRLVTVSLVGAVVLLLVVGIPVTAVLRQERDWALEQRVRAERAEAQARAAENKNMILTHLARAVAFRRSGQSGQRFKPLGEIADALKLDPSPELRAELRTEAISALALPDLYPVGPWLELPPDTKFCDFDEALPLYARTDHRGNCSVHLVADNREVLHLPGRGTAAMPVLSPDGEFLAVAHCIEGPTGKSVDVEVWNIGPNGGRVILSEAKARGAVFHPRLRQVTLVYDDGAIGLFDLPGGGLRKRLPPTTLKREVGIALHPTEPVGAVYSYFATMVELRDLGTGAILETLPQAGPVWGAAWHPDGRTLAVGQSPPNRIRLYDWATRQVVRTLECNAPSPLAFNRAGDRLVSWHSWSGHVELFDIGTGQQLVSNGPTWWLKHFSRDGRRLIGRNGAGKIGSWQVGDGREYRTLVPQARPEKAGSIWSTAVSEDGRMVAGVTMDGIGLWDLASGSELAFIPMLGGAAIKVRFEPSGALLVLNSTGLTRWPVETDRTTVGRLVVGPPVPLALPPGGILDQSRDGRVIVACSRASSTEESYAGGWILHADRPNDPPIRLDPGRDIGWIAVSPDGRWVVTASHSVGLAKMWDARDGHLIRQVTEFGAGPLHFSPDSRWLTTDADGGRLFAVETGEPGLQLGSAGTYSPDGRLVVVPAAGTGNHLIDPATGRTLATLEATDRQPLIWPVFTPDSAHLIGGGAGNGVRVWDLRLIRQQLAEMGLDWDALPYPRANDTNLVLSAPKVEVRLGDLGQIALAQEQQARRSIEAHREWLKANPNKAFIYNQMAWQYLIAPEALRDVNAALRLAEKAVEKVPGKAVFVNTLGLAYYRAGRYREVIEVLRPNIDRHSEWELALNLYILAMSHHRLGETAKAHDYFEWAVRWGRAQQSLVPEELNELDLLRTEASALLAVKLPGGVEVGPPPRAKK